MEFASTTILYTCNIRASWRRQATTIVLCILSRVGLVVMDSIIMMVFNIDEKLDQSRNYATRYEN